MIPGQLTAGGQVLFDGEVLVLARRVKSRDVVYGVVV